MKIMGKYFPYYRLRVIFFRAAGYKIGEKVYLGEDLIIGDELADRGQVTIGDRACVGERTTLITVSYPNFSRILSHAPTSKGPIAISQDAWIGVGAIIFPNTKVGEGSIVGAGSVVTRDVDPHTIVAGAPARILRRIDPPCSRELEASGEKKSRLGASEARR